MMQRLSRLQIAARAARDIQEGWYVNLGIGLPTLVAGHVPPEREVVFHSENGMLGMGPRPQPGEVDRDLIDAGKSPATLLRGGSFFNHADAFIMIRGGHLDLSIMGALEVSQAGDLANWTVDDAGVPPGVGGAMDLFAGARRLWILMEHVTKDGRPRVRRECRLPLTGSGRVSRIYTDLAVLEVREQQLWVVEQVPGLTADQLQQCTEAELHFDGNARIESARAPQ